MDPNGRRDKTRRIVIITLSAAIAGLTTALATSYERIGMGLAVATGYIILFMSAALVNSFLHNSASDTKRMLCLVFSICVLLLFLGGMAYLLFNQKDDETTKPEITEEIIIPEIEEEIEEETAEPDEIAIPSAPQVMWTVRIDDSSPHPVSEEPSDEISLQDEKSPRDSSETTAVIDSDNASSESAALIPEDPIFIGSMIRSIEDEIPSAPVFIESSVKAVEKDSVAIPDIPIFIEASIDEVKEDETHVVPVIIGGADLEDENLIYPHPGELSDDDFWADFYIQGTDTFTLLDGIYYMMLLVNDISVGEITVLMENGNPLILASDFRAYVESNITEEAKAMIFNSQGEYISLSHLTELGVRNTFDANAYEIHVYFSNEDMPIQILSLSSASRFSSRPIAGAERLKPASFVLSTQYNLSTSFKANHSFLDSLRFNFSTRNNVRLFDIYGNFSWYMDWTLNRFNFRFGSYTFYTDFRDKMIRLRWGNVDSDLLSPSGTSFGISFDKAIDYSGSNKRPSHLEQLLVIDKVSDVQIFNEGREIFRRTLQPGNYRLQDFVLHTGANQIRILVSPLDGTATKEMTIDLNYSSSLLAPGEIYYGAALVSARKSVSSSSTKPEFALRLPLWGNRSLEYDFRNVVLSGYIRSGLTTSLTMNVTVALQNEVRDGRGFNPNGALALEFIHANSIGTTKYNLNVVEKTENGRFVMPDFYGRISHQLSTGIREIASVNLGLTYSGDFTDNLLSFSTGFSGSVGILGWGLSMYISSDLATIDGLSWNLSNSYSLNLGRYVYLSAAIDVNGHGAELPKIGGRVSATFRFGNGSVKAGYDTHRSSISVNAYDSRNSFYADLGTTDFTRADIYDLSAEYSYAGDYVSVGVNADATNIFKDTGLSVSLSTASLFADGLFTVRSSIPSNFLLIKQKGALKGNEISVGRAGTSASEVLNPVFGNVLYAGLPYNSNTSLTIYSMGEDSFSLAPSFDVFIPAEEAKGYVLRLDAENSYSVSGVVEVNGLPWVNGSSPLYKVSYDNNNSRAVSATDIYVFTDSDGRFVISGLEAGVYAFDISSNEGWLSLEITVDENLAPHGINVLSALSFDEAPAEDSVYSFYGHYRNSENMDAEAFWQMLYPEMEAAV